MFELLLPGGDDVMLPSRLHMTVSLTKYVYVWRSQPEYNTNLNTKASLRGVRRRLRAGVKRLVLILTCAICPIRAKYQARRYAVGAAGKDSFPIFWVLRNIDPGSSGIRTIAIYIGFFGP